MSIRQYRPRATSRRNLSGNKATFLYLLFAVAIALQIMYPLVHGDLLTTITIFTVYSAAAVMFLHSYFAFGARFAFSFLFLTFAYALAVEIIGSKTGWPFGTYKYDHSLGFSIADVPLLVPFAWMMLTYPLLIAARKVGKSWVFLYGGLGLMTWDLFLDPQMVAANRWSWKFSGASIPFAKEIPLSNSAGWLFTGMGLMALLHWALPKDRRKHGASLAIPNIFLGWTLFSGIIGNLFFFHRPGIALLAGTLFGAVLAPYFFALRFGRPDSY
jgi:putative membrane protein